MKNTAIPKAIVTGAFLIAMDIISKDNAIFPVVLDSEADVAGMDYKALMEDKDFKKAVQYIVENCLVSGSVSDDVILQRGYNARIAINAFISCEEMLDE